MMAKTTKAWSTSKMLEPVDYPAKGDDADSRIGRAMRILDASRAAPPTTAQLAEQVGLSQFHLVRLFQEQTGENISHYARRIRLDGAARNLRRTKNAIHEIAANAGYGSQAAFTRAFTGRFGMSPNRYRTSKDAWFTYAEGQAQSVVVRNLEGFRCLARRYFGQYARSPERWADFISRLPDILRPGGAAFYISIAYDDPRVTPVEEIRHDCCVVPSADVNNHRNRVSIPGLQEITTSSGLYATTKHAGFYDHSIGKTYGQVTDLWINQQSQYQFGITGVFEIHKQPPAYPPAGPFEFELAFPIK